jgi:hypothetical protein
VTRYRSGSDEIESYYEPEMKEYFFDRNRAVFQPILGYYLSNGVMCLPNSINPDMFVEELRFFKMGPHVISRFAVQQQESSQWYLNNSFHFCCPLQKRIWIVSHRKISEIYAVLCSFEIRDFKLNFIFLKLIIKIEEYYCQMRT